MDFSDLDVLDEFFGMGDDSNPFMMLIWMLPIILFVFYGQRIQLIITSRDIKKRMSELEQFRNDSRDELINYIKQKLYNHGCLSINSKKFLVHALNYKNRVGNPIGFDSSLIKKFKNIKGQFGAKFMVKRLKNRTNFINTSSLKSFKDFDKVSDFTS